MQNCTKQEECEINDFKWKVGWFLLGSNCNKLMANNTEMKYVNLTADNERYVMRRKLRCLYYLQYWPDWHQATELWLHISLTDWLCKY